MAEIRASFCRTGSAGHLQVSDSVLFGAALVQTLKMSDCWDSPAILQPLYVSLNLVTLAVGAQWRPTSAAMDKAFKYEPNLRKTSRFGLLSTGLQCGSLEDLVEDLIHPLQYFGVRGGESF